MATEQEVREHNNKVLQNVERIELVAKYMESIGCSDVQASTVAKAYAEKFNYDGAVLSFNGKPVIESKDAVLAHFRDSHLEFLLPKANDSGDAPEVDPALLEQARGKNMTAYSQLARQHGKAAIDALLAKKPPDNSGGDKSDSKNPWRSATFRTDKTAQAEAARIIKALGTKAAAGMARAAGKSLDGRTIGA